MPPRSLPACPYDPAVRRPPESAPAPAPPVDKLPELLAPAGNWECARAAVENGADAIYFGLSRFNARMRADNFTEADLPALMEFLHRRGVRGYVTFNTLVFPDELAAAEEYLRAIIAAGVDAAIVQDVGICRLIRRLSPDFPIHGSTQMTVTSAAGAEFVRELGCQFVVLARECSIREIAEIRATLAAPADVAAAGGVRPRRAVRGVLRPMPDQRGAGRTLGQPWRMRAGVPDALRTHRRRTNRAAGRPPLSAQPAGPCGTRRHRRPRPRRGRLAQDRGPAEIARVRRGHHAGLPRRARPAARATRRNPPRRHRRR